jgi:peptidyl-prolyl cis-trans isomerase C
MPVTAAELTAILQANPPEARKNMLKDGKAFVEQLGLMRKLQAMAEEAKLDQKSPIKEQLALFRMQTLANAQVGAATDAIPVTLDDQKKFFEANRDRYTQAKVKVLFVSFRANPAEPADPKSRKFLSEPEAKAKIEKLLAQVRAGADFVKLLKENSEDTESLARDGDFGQPIRRSDSVPENIKSAIFSLKPGEVTDPVRVSAGFYLFRLEELVTQSFDEVASDIFNELRQKRFSEWMEKTQKSVTVKIENEEFFTKAAASAN